ncbi:MAG: sodium:calcium antiporter [Mycobacteriales bacterium]
MLHIVLLIASAAAIYFSCELFVNAVEHLGRLLKVGTLAVGTVLAAIGTALPESVVTGVAVTQGHTDDIGIGAALGGPLVLGTLAYAVVGVTLLVRRRPLPHIDTTRLGRDQLWFLLIFAVKIGLGLIAFAWKPWLGLVFFAVYVAYVVTELRAEHDDEEAELEPLRLGGSAAPGMPVVLVQTVAMLAVVFVASQVFVDQLSWAGPELGLSAAVTALLLAPVATELPEVMNALIWVRQGKSQLALSNISGSMMVQATVPSGLGILFTSWDLGGPLLLSAAATAAAVIFLLVVLTKSWLGARTLAAAGAFYFAFAVLLGLV